MITDNQQVAEGDLLIQLDPRDQQAALDNATATLASAVAQRTPGRGQSAAAAADDRGNTAGNGKRAGRRALGVGRSEGGGDGQRSGDAAREE
ncbi:biotin/lipoyl-binding protein [Defluviicoccus vanus]|uniref:biotin/lipoyl-binding protein n=1 Tax=Defluviicoccus vanus TaxID=111831 RepID=UPI001CBA66BD